LALFKKKSTEPEPVVDDMSSGSETDVQAVMAKYDRESNTRTFEGIPKKIVHWFFVAFSLYVVYMNLIANWGERERRASFVGLLIIMAFIMYPANRSERFKKRNYIPWYDAVLGLVGAFCFFWFVLNVDRIVNADSGISIYSQRFMGYLYSKGRSCT